MALNTLEQGQPHAHAVKEVINNYLHNKRHDCIIYTCRIFSSRFRLSSYQILTDNLLKTLFGSVYCYPDVEHICIFVLKQECRHSVWAHFVLWEVSVHVKHTGSARRAAPGLWIVVLLEGFCSCSSVLVESAPTWDAAPSCSTGCRGRAGGGYEGDWRMSA